MAGYSIAMSEGGLKYRIKSQYFDAKKSAWLECPADESTRLTIALPKNCANARKEKALGAVFARAQEAGYQSNEFIAVDSRPQVDEKTGEITGKHVPIVDPRDEETELVSYRIYREMRF